MDERYAYIPAQSINNLQGSGDSNLQLIKYYSDQIELYKKVIGLLFDNNGFGRQFEKDMSNIGLRIILSFDDNDKVDPTSVSITKK